MQAFPGVRSFDLFSLPGPAFLIPRTQLTFHKKLFFCRTTFAELGNDGSQTLGVVPPANLLAVLTLFLKKRGLSNVVEKGTVNASALFIDQLVSRLHSRCLGGRELTTLEIRDALYPYLGTIYEEFEDTLVDILENFPNPPFEERSIENLSLSAVPVSAPITTLQSDKLTSLARLTDYSPTGKLPPLIIYFTELGMELEVIKEVISKFRPLAYYSLDEKVKPVVEFLLDLGVTKSDIIASIRKWPQLCGVSLSEHITPTVTVLEDLGVDKKQWGKIIYRSPGIFVQDKTKWKSALDCLYELGLSTEKRGKVITRCPIILGYGVDKLRAVAQYFHSIGVDVGTIVHKCPQIFNLSVEKKLKLTTQFFLESGFSIEEVGFMVSRYLNFYTLSLSNNIMPKWEFYLTMCYPKSDLVKYPQYFGYSLELRIKPRYAILMESGVMLSLNTLLSVSDDELDELLKRLMEKNAG